MQIHETCKICWQSAPCCSCREIAALRAALVAIVETTEGQPGAIIQECRQIARKAIKQKEAKE